MDSVSISRRLAAILCALDFAFQIGCEFSAMSSCALNRIPVSVQKFVYVKGKTPEASEHRGSSERILLLRSSIL